MTSRSPAAEKKVKSLWGLGGLTLPQLGQRVWDEINANNAFGRAAELAFYFLFALFPLLLIMMTLFGLTASDNLELRNRLLSYFADFLPRLTFGWGALPGKPFLFAGLYLAAILLVSVATGFRLWRFRKS